MLLSSVAASSPTSPSTKSKGFNGGTLMVNIGWGLAVFAGVIVSYNSGAHLNPAVSIAQLDPRQHRLRRSSSSTSRRR